MAASDGPGTDLQIFGNVWYPFVVNVNMSINFIRLQIIDRLLYREAVKTEKTKWPMDEIGLKSQTWDLDLLLPRQ